jgi:glutamine synthetase type III
LVIKNTNILNNYLIPYLDNMTFYTKKGKDFNDFKIICRAIYNGVHRIEEIKPLILELSYTMNNYRLSTNSDPKKVSSLYLQENIDKIIKTEPTIIHLGDGRQLDIFTKKAVNRR